MKKNLKFKYGLFQSSETTAARLIMQNEQIQMDLEKLIPLQGKIDNKMQQAQSKMKKMQNDMKLKLTKKYSLKGLNTI